MRPSASRIVTSILISESTPLPTPASGFAPLAYPVNAVKSILTSALVGFLISSQLVLMK